MIRPQQNAPLPRPPLLGGGNNQVPNPLAPINPAALEHHNNDAPQALNQAPVPNPLNPDNVRDQD